MCDQTKHLYMTESGRIYRKVADGEDDELGFIWDDESEPHDHGDEWAFLRREWSERHDFADACERTATASYYDRLTPANWN